MHIHEFQEMMRRLYYSRDSRRGVKDTYDWLVEEVEELGDALENKNTVELEKEFADVLAWLSSLANIVSVNLERAAVNKYEDRCPKCGLSPCNCPF